MKSEAKKEKATGLRLHNLRPRPGARHRVKRLGCGESSGHGKTSGKGHKGQKARSGGSLRLGFEGGQMPLIRRLPKRGFNNAAFHKNYAIVNLTDLSSFKEGTVVNEQLLRDSNLIRGQGAGLKILGDGEVKYALKIAELRRRILFTLAVVVIVRLGAAITTPGVNQAVIQEWFRTALTEKTGGNVAALFNLFSGGALENCAIFSLGIMPYISASIMMQLLTAVVPQLGRLAREDGGRQKIMQYTRYATVALCIFQG